MEDHTVRESCRWVLYLYERRMKIAFQTEKEAMTAYGAANLLNHRVQRPKLERWN